MSKVKLFSAVFKSVWAIDERYVLASFPLLNSLMNDKLEPATTEIEDKIQFNVVSASIRSKVSGSMRRGYNWNEAAPGSIAVIPISGPLTKEDVDDCGEFSAGMATIASRIQEAHDHANIDAIILHIDTPGGTVDGTQMLADTIKNLDKPVTAFVDGLMASAGMWIGSASDRIIAQNTTTEIGSIGVMLSFMNAQPKYEKEGIQFHYIFAEQSSDKNRDILEAMKGKYDLIRAGILNPLADIFINAVKKNRGSKIKSEEVFTGKIYLAQEALDLGLIDEIGSIDVAVQRTSEMISKTYNGPIKKTNSKTNMKPLTLLMAAMGVANLEIQDGHFSISQEQAEALETALEAANAATHKANDDLQQSRTSVDTLTGQIAEANTARTNAESNAATLQTQLDEANATIETLKKGAGASSALATSETDTSKKGTETGASSVNDVATRMFDTNK